VLEGLPRLAGEPVPVGDALDRVLARDLHAAADVPGFANSAMDGFAVASGPAGRELVIAGESRAGAPCAIVAAPGEAIRISTGAALPGGTDSVVPVERAEEADGRVRPGIDAAPGLNVRAAGEDMRAGERVLRAGTVLGPAELGVAVGAGAAALDCSRKPRVEIVCTGDELRGPGEPLGPGEIHNSNAVTLAALVRRAGGEAGCGVRVGDDRAATEAALGAGLEDADVLIVSGGVSVGAHDHVKPALASLGVEERFWRVALRPGRPTWFGRRGERLVFGLPGNPASAMVTFLLLARPALRALQGASPVGARREASLAEPVPRNPAREEAVRVRLESGADGRPVAHPTGPQGSHRLRSMAGADGLALVPRGEGPLPAGAQVTVELI